MYIHTKHLRRLDEALSRPIFHLALPLPLECALTVPGAWFGCYYYYYYHIIIISSSSSRSSSSIIIIRFGCPLYSLGVVPLVAAACMPEESASVKAVLAPIILAAAAFWGKLCRDSLAEVSPSIARAYTFIGKRFLIFMPNMVMAILTFSGSVVGAKVASHYMTSWFFSQLLIEVFKGLAWRLRPVACMQDELDKIPRKLKELTAIVRQPAQANLSFPSGDAAGGAVFATAVTLAAPDLRGLLPGVSLVPIST